MQRNHSPKLVQLIVVGYRWECPKCGRTWEEEQGFEEEEVYCPACLLYFRCNKIEIAF